MNRSVEGVSDVIPPRSNRRVEGAIDIIHPGRTSPAEGARGPSDPIPMEIDDTGNGEADGNSINMLTAGGIRQIPLHLGHASPGIVMRVVRNSGEKVCMKMIGQILEECGREQELPKVSQNDIVSPHRAPWAWRTIGMDTWYPVQNSGNDHPFMPIVDKFSRMTVDGEVADLSIRPTIDCLSNRRMSMFGRPKRSIADNGANFFGGKFDAFARVWNITHVCTPAYSAYQGGIFDRTVGMLKV